MFRPTLGCNFFIQDSGIFLFTSYIESIHVVVVSDFETDSRHLQHVRTSILNNTACAAAWAGTVNITDNMLCAGGDRSGTCQVRVTISLWFHIYKV